MQFKDIHIGFMIDQKATEQEIEMSRICNYLKCQEDEIKKMYQAKNIDSEMLLRWSKLLGYDFFRIYSQHLILYVPHSTREKKNITSLPQFRKNIYTREIIDFILDQIRSDEMTIKEVMKQYRIPKTTIYKWINKYKK